ncbi:MAG TPA: protein kinase [Opitutaceae bacterium]|nr:protein kinase [Opitutaceae bacterium]
MTPHPREPELFEALLERPPAERAALLARECGGDAALRERLLALLHAHEEEDAVLDRPVTELWRDEEAPAEAIGARIGRYRLLRRIGEGGCGVVFEAAQEAPLQRRVALKIIKLGMDTREVVARFEGERAALALMDHPNIARIFDGGATVTGRPYFVMELIAGVPITRFCDERGLPVRSRLELFLPVCRAIQHAHEKGVVHRDIKPSNILVATYDPSGAGVPKVIDFGVAKALAARPAEAAVRTAVAQLLGTPAYMSPEQAAGAEVDARSDVYSLGALLHELLIGCPPLGPVAAKAEDLAEARRRIREERPPPPSARLEHLDRALARAIARHRGTEPDRLAAEVRGRADRIVGCCLEKDRGRRYRTAGALADDIARLLADQPVTAPRPGPLYRLRQLLRPREGQTETAAPPATPPVDPKSIAVLPFADLGAGAEHAFFAEGVHDDVIASLAKVRDLRVISRTSVLAYATGARSVPEIAADLRVAHVLEGTVRYHGSRARVSVRLVDARTGRPIWAETYDREAGDVFAIQSAIAREIAVALRATLSARERALIERVPTADAAAYAAYLRGRRLAGRSYDREDLEGATAALEEAVARDPQFALAWAHLSMAHGAMYWFTFLDPTPARLARCKATLDEALRLDPDLPEAHFALGVYHYRGFRDWAQAAAELEIALASLPNEAEVFAGLGLAQRRLGRWTASTANLERAVALDPRNGNAWLSLVDNHGFHRRWREALRACDRALAVAPGHCTALRAACWARFAVDDDRAALFAGLERSRRPPPDDARDGAELALLRGAPGEALQILAASPVHSFRDNKRELAKSDLQAQAAFLRGDAAQVREFAGLAAAFYAQSALHREPEMAFTTVSLGRALALLGRRDEALEMGQRAMQMLPPERDALWGPEIIGEHAAVCLLAGETEDALTQLAAMFRHPWDASANELRLHPLWRRLAGHPRFEAIVDGLEAG